MPAPIRTTASSSPSAEFTLATTLLETELKDSWRRVIGTERVPPFRQPVRQFILAEKQLDPAANDSVRQYLVRHDVRHQLGIPVIIVEFIQGRREMGRVWLKESGSMGRCVSGMTRIQANLSTTSRGFFRPNSGVNSTELIRSQPSFGWHWLGRRAWVWGLSFQEISDTLSLVGQNDGSMPSTPPCCTCSNRARPKSCLDLTDPRDGHQ